MTFSSPMPAAYSDDLRQKVMDAIDRGERKSTVCRMFNIGRNTLDLWLKRRQATGSVQAPKGYQTGHGHKLANWDRFRAFVQLHGDKTQAEMAELWEGEISSRTLARGLKKIGFTRKKTRVAKIAGERARNSIGWTQSSQRL